MQDVLTYLFWPNPGMPVGGYGNPKVLLLFGCGVALIIAGAVIRSWRRRMQNPVTKRLSSSWSAAAFWFGIVSIFLTVSRVEMISFVAMRILWLIWALSVALYLLFQIRSFRARHYEVLPKERIDDPRTKYLPKRK